MTEPYRIDLSTTTDTDVYQDNKLVYSTKLVNQVGDIVEANKQIFDILYSRLETRHLLKDFTIFLLGITDEVYENYLLVNGIKPLLQASYLQQPENFFRLYEDLYTSTKITRRVTKYYFK